MTVALDPSGLLIPQTQVAFRGAKLSGTGSITYRCHTCGESITKPWETFFADPSPATAWASDLVPPRMTPTMTTHHRWHMATTQEG